MVDNTNTPHVPVEHDVEEDPGSDGVHDKDEAIHHLLGAASLSTSLTHLDYQLLRLPPVDCVNVSSVTSLSLRDGRWCWCVALLLVISGKPFLTNSCFICFISIVTLRFLYLKLNYKFSIYVHTCRLKFPSIR